MSILKFILIGWLVLLPTQDDWVKIKGDQQITFLFPSRGERFKKEVNGMRSWIFQTKNLTCVFGVVCTQLTEKSGVLDAYTLDQLYIAMKKESVSMPTAKLLYERRFPQRSLDVREISYSWMKDTVEMTYFKRFIFRDNYMYQITIGGDTKDLEEIVPQKDKFFNSVKFETDTRDKSK